LAKLHTAIRQLAALSKAQAAYNFHFRTEALLWSAIDLVQFLVLFFVIQAIYGGDSTVNGVSLAYSLQYYLILIVIGALTTTHFEEWLGGLVRYGKIDMQLIKPVSANILYGWTGIIRKLTTFIIKLPLMIGFFVFVSYFFGVGFPRPETSQIFQLSLLLVGCLVVMTAISLIIGWLTFWFENASSLSHLKGVLLGLFSGTMLPPQLFPDWLEQLTFAMPFKYFGVIPAQVWLGTYTLGAYDALYFGLFALVTFVLLRLTYQRGIRRYVSAGG
jgi:ABC-2 type transport system permease protein